LRERERRREGRGGLDGYGSPARIERENGIPFVAQYIPIPERSIRERKKGG